MILDAHAHLFHERWYPPKFRDALVRDYVQRMQLSGRQVGAAGGKAVFRMLTDDTGQSTVKIMDRAGIDKRIILVLDWAFGLGEASESIWQINRDILEICTRFKDRLIGFAGVDPRRPDAASLVKWAVDSMGARGLKLHPTSDWRLDEERTHVIVDVVAQRRLPVLVHVGKTVDVLSDRNAQPDALMALARAFPETLFVAGHSGFESWRRFVRPDTPTNIYFDISGWQGLLTADRVRFESELVSLTAAFPGRVCFGSDSPFFTYNIVASERGWIDSARACLEYARPKYNIDLGSFLCNPALGVC